METMWRSREGSLWSCRIPQWSSTRYGDTSDGADMLEAPAWVHISEACVRPSGLHLARA
jgi:hypothetical protein